MKPVAIWSKTSGSARDTARPGQAWPGRRTGANAGRFCDPLCGNPRHGQPDSAVGGSGFGPDDERRVKEPTNERRTDEWTYSSSVGAVCEVGRRLLCFSLSPLCNSVVPVAAHFVTTWPGFVQQAMRRSIS